MWIDEMPFREAAARSAPDGASRLKVRNLSSGPRVVLPGQLDRRWRNPVSLGTIILIILILALIGVLPTWGHSRSWGYGPSGIVGLIVVVLIVLLLMGRL
jgi:hypothetical protein